MSQEADWRALANSTNLEDRRRADALGLQIDDFTPDELKEFMLSFARMFRLHTLPRVITEIFNGRIAEIRLAAKVAKAQFNASFGGEQPDSGQYGMVITRAGYFGIGNDWDDARPLVRGVTYIIDSGTTRMGGTSGNPVRIGGNAVHLILAQGTLSTNPRTEATRFIIDTKIKAAIPTWFHYNVPGDGQIKVKELDKVRLLRKGNTLAWQAFSSTSGPDANYLLGVSFLPEAQLRELDINALSGTTPDVVLTT
jgi:hypothetical protein